MKMNRFGCVLFPWSIDKTSVESVITLTRKCEELGYDSVQFGYQLMPLYYERARKMGLDNKYLKYILEAVVILTLMARETKRLHVAFNAAVLPYMHPLIWARQFATIDILSRGRFWMGVCAGSAEDDFRLMRIDWKERGRIMNEQLEAIIGLLQEDNVSYHGRYYSFEKITIEPKPIQKPRPPLLIAGTEASIPRCKKFNAEYFCPAIATPEQVKKKFKPGLKGTRTKVAILSPTAAGTNKSDVEKAAYSAQKLAGWFNQDARMIGIVGSPGECAEKIREYLNAGTDYFILDVQQHGLIDTAAAIRQMEIFAREIVPRV